MNTTLSLAMIVRNSEAILARCLDSVKDLVDEIIIVDTGSTDKTKEIAKNYTDKIFDFKWINDFSAARNFSFSKCTKDFIFWLDDDDVVTESEKKKIRELDFSDKEIILCQYNYSRDEFGNVTSVVARSSIVKRSLNLIWQEPIHEYLPLNRKVYNSDIHIEHYKQSDSTTRNLKILEKIVKKNPENPRNVYYLGRECADQYLVFHKEVDYKKAIKYLEKFVEMKDGWWEDKYRAYYFLARCYYNSDEQKFKDSIFKSISIEERRAEPFFLLGMYCSDKKQWNKAIQWYETCLRIKRPKELWGTYQPDLYTIKPHRQLCLCYGNIGEFEIAQEHNSEVLKYRPQDKMALFNKKWLEEKLNKKKDGQGKKLNLGCGDKILSGYVNVDLFEGEGVDEVFNFEKIPYSDNSISSINSEHSLEHLPLDKIRPIISEWFRVLQPGGELLLKIPDLELCIQSYFRAPMVDVNFYKTKAWFKNTIFGIQRSLKGEPDEAQFHKSGFSKDEIRIILEDTGFVIDYLENYDGFRTPSIGIRALKPINSNLKIGWISSINWDAAQTRLRVLKIDQWLRSRGYYSKIVNYPEIINQNYDVAIVGKTFDEHHFKNIRMLKQHGKTVFCDLCEDIFNFSWVKEIVQICDKVICCSHILADKVKIFNQNTVVIEEAYES